LPDTLGQLSSMIVNALGTLILVSVITPLFLVVIFPILFLYRRTENYYLSASREMKRIESVTKSPLLALYQEAYFFCSFFFFFFFFLVLIFKRI
jgi:ATP-binding cassette subfamily C (CFTR/MRP) protein 1